MIYSENSQKFKYKLVARELFNDKNYEEALKFYNLSIENEESNPDEQLKYICQCLLKLGWFDEVENEYENYYQKHHDEITLFNLVSLNCRLCQFDRAEKYHQKFKKEYISNIQIESQVIIYFYQRKYREALKELEKIGNQDLDELMLFIQLGQIQYITKKDVSIKFLKNQQLHIIFKSLIEFDEIPQNVIQQQLKHDKIRQQFYQDIYNRQINPQYFDLKRFAYFEPFEQEFLLRQSKTWETSLRKQIQIYHKSLGKLTLVQQKFLIIYNHKKYQQYFSDMITVFDEFSNLSQQFNDLIQTIQQDKQQLQQVRLKFSLLEYQTLSNQEIQEIITGIEESIKERIQFIGIQQQELPLQIDQLHNDNKSNLCLQQVNQSSTMIEKVDIKDQFILRQGIIDSYLILFMRQRNCLQLDKVIVRDYIQFSLVKIFQ